VHALLRLEIAVGVFTLDLDRDRLDAGLFAGQQVEHRDLEAVPLRPADIHPHQHLGPVLRLGPARAGMDRQQRVPAVVGSLQHRLELEGLDGAVERVGLTRHLLLQRGIGLGFQQLRHLERAGDASVELLPRRDPSLQRLDLLYRRPGAVGVGPESHLRLGPFERPEPFRLGGQVKGSLGVR
jgi:hypothetical protein